MASIDLASVVISASNRDETPHITVFMVVLLLRSGGGMGTMLPSGMDILRPSCLS
jgi:hypothetical protein